jgi:hypothetical protein
MANKPDKFGMKFWLLIDVDAKYLLNGFPYPEKDKLHPVDESLLEHITLQLMDPYLKKGRNVTTDNFFTLAKLAEKLKAKDTN